jgi:hypothetical protein
VSPISVAGTGRERQVRHAELAGTIDHFAGTHDPQDNPGPPNRNRSVPGQEEEEEKRPLLGVRVRIYLLGAHIKRR